VDDVAQPLVTAGPSGFSPADLRSAYNITGQGSSATTIAIVDAYGYATAESDLAVYRAQFGLPACTTANGCFKKVNQNDVAGSYPRANVGWSQETALDLDMASAICPNCKLLLVEASSASIADLGTAVNTAVRLGAQVVSNSYGGFQGAGSLARRLLDHRENAGR
jgi:subtilase family serine protease